MEIFSHLLWSFTIFRNRLWREEALFFAVLPDASFLLIMLYVLLGTPMNVGFQEAMLTMPYAFKAIYFLMHSFVTLGIVALVVWWFKPKLLPALLGWLVHICMDIPFHDGEFATRFLYPISPDIYIKGMFWTDIRILAAAYFALSLTLSYALWRESKKHKKGQFWKPDLIDKGTEFCEAAFKKLLARHPKFRKPVGDIINQDGINPAHAEVGDIPGASGQVPGEDPPGTGESQNRSAGAVPPQEAG